MLPISYPFLAQISSNRRLTQHTQSIMSLVDLSALSPSETALKLPHPYQTEYTVRKVSCPAVGENATFFQLALKDGVAGAELPPVELHSNRLCFSAPLDLKSSELPPSSNNSPWARSRRSPFSSVRWDGAQPSLAQAWMLLYLLYSVRPGMEMVRLELKGQGAGVIAQQLKDVLLAIEHPSQAQGPQPTVITPGSADEAVVVGLRSTFWQGAGSPFGARPIWCPTESPSSLPGSNPLASYPLTPLQHTISVASAGDPQDPGRYQQYWHPIRPAKPAPGAVVYSRWIPHLKETFSMVSLDYTDAEHLRLFHEWQNDPRVSQGWNETGTLDEHRQYLKNIHEDPHQVAVLAKWDDVYFAYFEVYWAKASKPGKGRN